jgi:hypothetical protein
MAIRNNEKPLKNSHLSFVITGSREPEPQMKGRYFLSLFSRISRAFFSPGFCRFLSGTSLDSMYEQ